MTSSLPHGEAWLASFDCLRSLAASTPTWTLLALLLPAFGAIAAASPLDGKVRTENELTSRVVSLVREVPVGNARLGVFVQTLDDREILANIGGEESLTPASNFKLYTSAAGLALLGPDFTWKTDIAATGEVDENGTLRGNLVLVGRGDPTLGGRFNPGDTTDLTWQFREWAARLKALGIQRIQGDVVGDDDHFDDVLFGTAWYPDERAEWYCAEVSALSFNDGCIDLVWRGAKKAGLAPEVALNPPTEYCRIVNQVTTIADTKKDWRIRYHREETGNDVRARGEIPVNERKYHYAAIHNPTLFTTTVVLETLRGEGIAVSGRARDIDEFEDKTQIREGMKTLFTHTSPPLTTIIDIVNRNSQNLYAELLLRTLGKEFEGEGSFEAGCRVVETFLGNRRALRNGYCCVDGSGLSYLNRTSVRQLVDLLLLMNTHEHRDAFHHSLPQGGVRGSLRIRFNTTDAEKRVAERIFAKTGWIGGVHSLGGYIQGEPAVAFSIIINGFECPDRQARDLVDRLAVEIAEWNAPLEITPLPPPSDPVTAAEPN